ncbi:STAS domain-containing protein [Streptomyces sp. NPDC008317]|uniref:STAS domain-containing protein n=1 Tax=Streptomyces sp. NPDC008317 TaxID=3364827 RepID=UPI0036E3FBB4
MTTIPPSHLRLTAVDTETTVRIELHGDLDYDNADRLLAVVSDKIADNPRLADLHLHCAGLGSTDSSGLSALLMIRRRTDEAGVRLHLDDRSSALERLLTITGTLAHLTALPATGAGAAEPSAADQAAPSTGQDPRA